MAFQDDYDNATRTLLIDKAEKNVNGVPLYTINLAAFLTTIAGISYIETLHLSPEAITAQDDIATVKIHKFTNIQLIEDVDIAKGYSPDMVQELHSWA